MIGISRLYCSCSEGSDSLRYARPGRGSGTPRPVVVWNATRRCNLHCAHCYSSSTDSADAAELTTAQALAMIDDLASCGVPVLLFSGGEPMLRADLLELIGHARARGLRAVVSTNGTLIGPQEAGQLAAAGVSYVGVSLDGLEAAHDAFRGRGGAFAAALQAIRNCRAAGVKAGLRLTMARRNFGQIDGIFDLVGQEGIERVCFYHLAYTGRGSDIRHDDLTGEQTRQAVDLMIDRTAALHASGRPVQVLTVDNHADGAYLYLRLLREDPPRAAAALELLRINGGNSSGCGIACVSWNGDVLPDQFWRKQVLGNVMDRPFSEIWADESQPLLAKLRRRKEFLPDRCGRCRFLDICNGNLRARAEAASGDPWGEDPACYLTDEEIRP